MGGRFWLGVVGVTILCGLVGLIGFLLISAVWAKWGFLAMFLVIAGLALLAGWIVDRRNANRESAY